MSMNINRDPFHVLSQLSDLAGAVSSTVSDAASAVQQAVAAVTDGSVDATTSPEAQATAAFEAQFGELAQDKEAFHAMMKQVYGDNYDAAKAEEFRQMALNGDYSFLPPVQFVSRDTLQGGNGAYNEADGVIYLAEDLKNNPQLMQQTFIEEAGHHLDAMLNTGDSVGDEGELFRRLLSGENLSASQIADIRAENDKGTIIVDGKAVEVEFWGFDDLVDAVGDAASAVGNAVSDAVDAVGDAVGEVVDGVGDALGMVASGIAGGIGGFFTNLVQLRVGDAFQSLIDGADKAFLQAPKRLGNAAINAFERVINAPSYFLPDFIGEPVRDLQARAVDNVRSVVNAAADMARNTIRTAWEMPLNLGRDLFDAGAALVRGDFQGALAGLGWAVAHPFVSAGGLLVDNFMIGAQATANVVGNTLFLHEPSRPLTDDEKAYLRELYGDSIDVDSIRVHTDNISTQAGIAPHTIGNDIYIPSSATADDGTVITYVNPDGTLTDEGRILLAHEAFHAWQHQNNGSDYISQSLWAQLTAAITGGDRGGAYIWQEGADAGTPFSELNPEQQAELLEDIAAARLRDATDGDDVFNEDDFGTWTDSDGNVHEVTPEQFEYAMAAWEEIQAGNGTA